MCRRPPPINALQFPLVWLGEEMIGRHLEWEVMDKFDRYLLACFQLTAAQR